MSGYHPAPQSNSPSSPSYVELVLQPDSTPAYFSQLTVTDSALVAITTHKATSLVTVGEDPTVSNWPTTGFKVFGAASGQGGGNGNIAVGQQFTFEAPPGFQFPSGTTVGWLEAATGTTTVDQYEQ